MWIRCEGNYLQLLGFWNFFNFFRFFPLKLVYFWTKSRKNTYGCFFHSFCAANLNFGTKNNGRVKSSILKTLIFHVFDLQFQIARTFLRPFLWTFSLAYSPLKSATLSCSSEVTLLNIKNQCNFCDFCCCCISKREEAKLVFQIWFLITSWCNDRNIVCILTISFINLLCQYGSMLYGKPIPMQFIHVSHQLLWWIIRTDKYNFKRLLRIFGQLL